MIAAPLPKLFEDAISSVCKVHQCPRVFLVAGMISAISTAACRYDFKLGAYTNRPITWICLVSRTGSGKTPALNAALKPLSIYQARMDTEAKQKHKTHKASLARHRTLFAEQLKNPLIPDDELLSEPELELTEHRIINDSTFEGLLKTHEGIGGICLFADELNGWLQSFTRYSSSGSSRAGWLELFSEPMSIKSTRVTDGHSRSVDRPTINVLGGIQPRLLHKLKDGLDDGLSHRLLYIFPPDADMVERVDRGHLDNEKAYAAYVAAMVAFLNAEETHAQASIMLATNSAGLAINDWVNQGIKRFGKSTHPEHDEDKQGMFAKLQSYAHRLAGIHSIMRCISDNAADINNAVIQLRNGYQIEVEDVAWAANIIDDVFIPSAERATEMMLTGEDLAFERRMPSTTEVNFFEMCPRNVPFQPFSADWVLKYKLGVPQWNSHKLASIKTSIQRIMTKHNSHFLKSEDGYIYVPNEQVNYKITSKPNTDHPPLPDPYEHDELQIPPADYQ